MFVLAYGVRKVIDAFDEKPGLSGCPYYQGTGTCFLSGLCHAAGEPLCITNEPSNGWAEESDSFVVRVFAKVRGWWRGKLAAIQSVKNGAKRGAKEKASDLERWLDG